MKAFGTPVKIAALEFHSVFCERRCCVNVEQGQDAGGPVCPLVAVGGLDWIWEVGVWRSELREPSLSRTCKLRRRNSCFRMLAFINHVSPASVA